MRSIVDGDDVSDDVGECGSGEEVDALTSSSKGNCHWMASVLPCQHEHLLAKGTTMGEAVEEAMVALVG